MAKKQTEEEKVQAFNAELKALLGKYGYALGAEAFIHEGRTLAKPTLVKIDSQTKSVLDEA